MGHTTFDDLLSPAGQEVLLEASRLQPREADFLAHFQALCRHHPADLSRLALETAILRREAQAKFPEAVAQCTYWTREALEQASSYAVAAYRAARYQQYPAAADLGCSAGGDTLALAKVTGTIGVDRDANRLRLAQANLRALGLGEKAAYVQADLSAGLPLKAGSAALFFDPARRAAGRRIYSVKEYQPPLEVVWSWLDSFAALGVKLSPGVDHREIEEYPAEREFISLKGELKEAVLWFGPLRTTDRRATLLPGKHTLHATAQEIEHTSLPLTAPGGYLYEPDPAILRAGLVTLLGQQIHAAQLDPDIAYLTSDQHHVTPFARTWQVLDWLPFQLKRLRQYLRQRGIGHLVVKKRGSPLEPEKLIRDLRLEGEKQAVLFLTHLQGKPIAILAEEVPPGAPG
ncbi:MAG: hypothetical protein MUC85_05250 [Anaerolineales bacterium]|jgi:hypothetical protein|nr:hypothetical protein [Anaerolineales bacterium]